MELFWLAGGGLLGFGLSYALKREWWVAVGLAMLAGLVMFAGLTLIPPGLR